MDLSARYTITAGVVGQAKLDQLNDSLKQTGKAAETTAKQTAQAMRLLPAQFTDVVTQLAGGQNPFLILLQQGGQVRDQFGSFGNMARGILSFFTPLRLAIGGVAAAAGMMAYAFYQGQKQSEELSRALALTGNRAGMTAASFESMVQRARDASSVTAGIARELAQGAVASGVFGPGSIDAVVGAMSRLQKISGQASEDIVKDFAGMQGGVAKWAAEHNRAYNFLTVEQFQYIKGLEDQGRKEEAMRETAKALDDAMRGREVQLGSLSRAWKSVGEMASWAWDKMLNVGRADSSSDMLAKAQAELQRMESLQNAMGKGVGGGVAKMFYGDQSAAIAQQRQIIANLQEQIKLEGRQASAMAANAAANQSAIDQIASGRAKQLADMTLQLQSSALEGFAQRRVAALELEMAKLDALNKDGVLSEQQYADRVLAIKRQMLQEEVLLVQRQIALEKSRKVDLPEDAAQQAIRLQQLNNRLAAAKAKIPLAEAEAAGDTNARVLADSRDKARAWEQVWMRSRDAIKSMTDQNARGRIALITDPIQRMNAEIDQDIVEIKRKAEELTGDLSRQIEMVIKLNPGMAEELKRQLEEIKRLRDEAVGQKEASRPQNQGWLEGLRAGWREWGSEAGNVAKNVRDATMRTMDQLGDAIGDWVTTGKANFKEFARSVLSDLSRMLMKMALFNAVKAGAEALGFGGAFADGGAFAGGVQKFAVGGIVDQPTPFAFAGAGGGSSPKLGLMGEAGPEAIMPLRRTSGGRLGVEVAGGSAAPVTVVVNVDASGATDQKGGDKDGAQLGRMVATAVRSIIVQEQRPGGLLAA